VDTWHGDHQHWSWAKRAIGDKPRGGRKRIKCGCVDARAVEVLKGGVSRVILTSVGEGPIRTEESLIAANGEPLKK